MIHNSKHVMTYGTQCKTHDDLVIFLILYRQICIFVLILGWHHYCTGYIYIDFNYNMILIGCHANIVPITIWYLQPLVIWYMILIGYGDWDLSNYDIILIKCQAIALWYESNINLYLQYQTYNKPVSNQYQTLIHWLDIDPISIQYRSNVTMLI